MTGSDGMLVLKRCFGCNVNRPQLGSQGTGLRWRCAHCVRARDAQKVGA